MDKRALRDLVVLVIAQALIQASTVYFNGQLNDSHIVDSLRDWVTLAQGLGAAGLAVWSRHAPRGVSLRGVSAVCAAFAVFGALLASWGSATAAAVPLVVGACLMALARTWVSITFLIVLSRLRLWQMAAVLTLGSALSIPLARIVSAGGYAVTLVCETVSFLALLAFVAYCGRRQFTAFADAEPAADAALTSPRAVLPLGHDLFVYTFLFCAAYGFGLRYEHADGNLLANGVLVALYCALACLVLVRRAAFKVDTLFNVAFILVLVGFLLVLLDEASLAWHASVVLAAGSETFALLMCLALAAVAARNPAAGLPTVAWGYAVYYAGIEVGAQLGIFATWLGPAWHLGGKLVVCAVLVVICVYTLYSIRDFGFDKTIEGVQAETAPAALDPQAEIDAGLSRRCGELAGLYGLTEREGEVFALLVRGKNAARVCQELAITKNTLKYHVRHIYEKCGVHSQQELIDLL